MNYKIIIPKNEVISENGKLSINEIVNLFRKYKNEPIKIQFLADMMEE
ncbi:MAG: hypothetical protein ABI543_09395 [Ignavibacteria bacterium]